MKTTLEIDPNLLAQAEQAAAEMGKPLDALVEHSLKLFLNRERRVLQAPPGGYRGGSLDRDDPFSFILAQIQQERHARLPREPVLLD